MFCTIRIKAYFKSARDSQSSGLGPSYGDRGGLLLASKPAADGCPSRLRSCAVYFRAAAPICIAFHRMVDAGIVFAAVVAALSTVVRAGLPAAGYVAVEAWLFALLELLASKTGESAREVQHNALRNVRGDGERCFASLVAAFAIIIVVALGVSGCIACLGAAICVAACFLIGDIGLRLFLAALSVNALLPCAVSVAGSAALGSVVTVAVAALLAAAFAVRMIVVALQAVVAAVCFVLGSVASVILLPVMFCGTRHTQTAGSPYLAGPATAEAVEAVALSTVRRVAARAVLGSALLAVAAVPVEVLACLSAWHVWAPGALIVLSSLLIAVPLDALLGTGLTVIQGGVGLAGGHGIIFGMFSGSVAGQSTHEQRSGGGNAVADALLPAYASVFALPYAGAIINLRDRAQFAVIALAWAANSALHIMTPAWAAQRTYHRCFIASVAPSAAIVSAAAIYAGRLLAAAATSPIRLCCVGRCAAAGFVTRFTCAGAAAAVVAHVSSSPLWLARGPGLNAQDAAAPPAADADAAAATDAAAADPALAATLPALDDARAAAWLRELLAVGRHAERPSRRWWRLMLFPSSYIRGRRLGSTMFGECAELALMQCALARHLVGAGGGGLFPPHTDVRDFPWPDALLVSSRDFQWRSAAAATATDPAGNHRHRGDGFYDDGAAAADDDDDGLAGAWAGELGAGLMERERQRRQAQGGVDATGGRTRRAGATGRHAAGAAGAAGAGGAAEPLLAAERDREHGDAAAPAAAYGTAAGVGAAAAAAAAAPSAPRAVWPPAGAPALPAAGERPECAVCMANAVDTWVHGDHVVCAQCIAQEVRDAVRTGDASRLPARCPLCRGDPAERQQLLPTALLETLIPAEDLRLHDRAAVRAAGIILVICPGCHEFLSTPELRLLPALGGASRTVTCATPACRMRFCLDCERPAHPGARCAAAAAAARAASAAAAGEAAFERLVQEERLGRCPCGAVIQRTGGCNHMQHAPCDHRRGGGTTHFCYLCGSELDASLNEWGSAIRHFQNGPFTPCRPQTASPPV